MATIEKAILRTADELVGIASAGSDLKVVCEQTLGRIELLRDKVVSFMRKEEGL